MRGLTAFIVTLMIMVVSAAADERPVNDRLRTLLSDRHYHASEEAVKELGPDVNAALKEIAGDESEPIFRRVRAVSALGYFDDDETSLFLENIARANGRLVAIRWAALRSLARSKGNDSVELISGYLKDDNRFTRRVAGNSLQTIGSEKALRLLGEARREGYIPDSP
ncbi:MAG TPA: HEAT repeat domain-containing protein [Nitrospirae bacterium]|nr:HEAT repeat domain-containing protein [Nitrospirota bacterium]